MKKLFTTFLMMAVALVCWGQDTTEENWQEWSGGTYKWEGTTLTVRYTGGEYNLGDFEGSEKEWYLAIETLVLEGPFTNNQWKNDLDEFAQKCANHGSEQTEYINLDLSGCTSIVSKVQTSADYLSKDYKYIYTNETTTVSVTKTTAWVNTDGTIVESWQNIYTDDNGSYWDEWNNGYGPKHYVTQQEVWVDQYGNAVPTSSVTPTSDTEGTADIPADGTAFAFDKCKNVLKGLTFPNSDNFLAIPDRLCCPETCPNLETVSFENTQIVWIGQYAFGSYAQNQSLIGNVTFPTTLKVIGADAFKNCTNFTKVDLSNLTNLVKIDYAAFNMGNDDWNNLTEVYLPQGSNLVFFANQVFSSSHVETLDFSRCTGIKYFAYSGLNQFGEGTKDEGVSSVATFYWHHSLKTLILPPTLEQIGVTSSGSGNMIVTKECPLLENLVFTGTEDNNDLVIGQYAFAQNPNLTNITFSPNLERIIENAFYQDINIDEVDLSGCHRLTLVDQNAFGECSADDNGILTVRVCSHPKVLKGPHGSGAFNNTKTIRTVEVVACDNTFAEDCVCEAGAFDFDVTNVQTQVDNVDVAARLIFPRDLPVRTGDAATGYESAYDFYVGNYKLAEDGSSALITQSNLQTFYKTVPCESTTGKAYLPNPQEGYPEEIGAQRYYYNGWLEFINTGDAEIVPAGEFLRTYSRSVDTGVTLLPAGITAYRAIDYISEDAEYVQVKKGDYVNINEKEGGEPEYVEYATMNSDDQTKYKKYKRYALLTIKGKVMLKALRPIHQYMDDGTLVSEVDNSRSYVPERTGVVLYSTSMNEQRALLIFGNNYNEVDYLFPEYSHTEGRYETERLKAIEANNTEIDWTDNINMLQGSYDQECMVAPVLPWDWDNNKFFADNKEYRNFGFSKAAYGGEGGWVRLQPGQLRLNRAFAKIPADLFNNFNESESQSPEFYLEDRVATDSGVNTICVLGSSFDEDMTDGILTISTAAPTYEKDVWYTLQGVKVSKPNKGVYIYNNKKVVIK